ncbi:hypothetical protein [Agathobaculum sp.]|uniref:hypothetical protein n=1 Tax=Agathobaculum sp. TaxID=2048138 RepID=UPI002A82F873|nr:hypothetical protein [Agathobaculum sp.]MDY3619278.1 hypothetical protein [Agathobaculum sp.]
MDYEKPTYRMFFVWIAAFLAVMAGGTAVCSHWPDTFSGGAAIKLILLLCLLMLLALFYYIYRTGRVYWFNGVTYKEAAKAGGERRHAYAWAHLRVFLLAGAVFAVYCAAGAALHTGAMLDTAVFLVVLLTAAFSTLRIKL